MSVLLIPTSADPYQTQKVRLDGTDYLLSLSYNQREDRLYLSLADDEENPIVSGIKVLANFPMLFRYRYNPAVPAGEIFAFDLTTDGSPPSLAELGEGLRCELTYIEAATLAEINSGVPIADVT